MILAYTRSRDTLNLEIAKICFACAPIKTVINFATRCGPIFGINKRSIASFYKIYNIMYIKISLPFSFSLIKCKQVNINITRCYLLVSLIRKNFGKSVKGSEYISPERFQQDNFHSAE